MTTSKSSHHIDINQGVADGNALAIQAHANTGPDLPRKVGGPVFIEVYRSDPSDLTALLLNIETEEVLTEDEFTRADLIHWREDDQHFIRKNSAGGPIGYVTPETFAAVVAELTKKAEVNKALAVAEPAAAEPTVPTTTPVGTGENVETLSVPTATALKLEAKDEVVVQLAMPASPTGPFFRKDKGELFDLKSSTASYVYYHAAPHVTIVLRNTLSARRTPYKIRPTIASNEVALAKRLHGKTAEEIKTRVRATATRSGPATPLAAWVEMAAAFALFPDLIEKLNLSDAELDGLIKLLHNGGFMVGQKATSKGVFFVIPDAKAPNVEVRGEGELAWVDCGRREPAELIRLSLLVTLIDYRDSRRNRGQAAGNYNTELGA